MTPDSQTYTRPPVRRTRSRMPMLFHRHLGGELCRIRTVLQNVTVDPPPGCRWRANEMKRLVTAFYEIHRLSCELSVRAEREHPAPTGVRFDDPYLPRTDEAEVRQ